MSKRMSKTVLSLALGSVLALALASVALATHPRPERRHSVAGSARSRVQAVRRDRTRPTWHRWHSVPVRRPCWTSAILTTGTQGAANGSSRLDIFCTDGQVAPCSTNAGDQEDIRVVSSGNRRTLLGGRRSWLHRGRRRLHGSADRAVGDSHHRPLERHPADRLCERHRCRAVCHRHRHGHHVLRAGELRRQRRGERRQLQHQHHDRHAGSDHGQGAPARGRVGLRNQASWTLGPTAQSARAAASPARRSVAPETRPRAADQGLFIPVRDLRQM